MKFFLHVAICKRNKTFFGNEGDSMRKWGLLLVLLIVVACNDEQMAMDTKADAQLQATIPANVVEQYGLLQIEKKFNHLDSVKHANGSVTFLLDLQEVAQFKEEVNTLFAQYDQAISKDGDSLVTEISYDELYHNIHFYVANESVIYDENFVLVEELLVKHALAYQLIHEEPLSVAVLYYDKSGEHVLSKKTIPIQVSHQN